MKIETSRQIVHLPAQASINRGSIEKIRDEQQARTSQKIDQTPVKTTADLLFEGAVVTIAGASLGFALGILMCRQQYFACTNHPGGCMDVIPFFCIAVIPICTIFGGITALALDEWRHQQNTCQMPLKDTR